MSDAANLFGKAKYGTQQSSGGRIRGLQKGDTILRIMPPFKSLAAKGAWAQYLAQHFGYKGNDSKNPGKTKARAFQCPQDINRKTKMVITPCPECDEIASKQSLLETRTNNMRGQGKSKEEIDQATEHLAEWLKNHNRDQKQYVNAMTQEGEFIVVPLPLSVKKEIDAIIEKLMKNKIDPLDVSQGVWFVVSKTGEGFRTEYSVDFLKESFTGPDGFVYERAKLAPLTAQQLEKAGNECADLPTVLWTLTHDQIVDLVKSSGDPDEVDRIFNAGTRREASPRPAATAAARPAPAPAPASVPAPTIPVAPAAPAAAVTGGDGEDEEAALLAALAAAKARKAAAAAASAPAPAPVQAAPAPAAAPAVDPLDPSLSTEDFMKLFGNR